MSFIVFIGPSLDRVSAYKHLQATYMPPASQGDVYLAARNKPWGIGIIDGYFKHAPAVWHKEILWALSQGVHVFGSASMGALRAAELASFGMQGVGQIFTQFASGDLENDDEVAIIHSAADDGYQPLSEAMVNIRFTVEAALQQFVISEETQDQLINIAADTYYEDRNYHDLLESARLQGTSSEELDRFRTWLTNGKIDAKRTDAIQMLKTMANQFSASPAPVTVNFNFQHTDAWEQVRRQIHLKSLQDNPAAATHQGDATLSELKLKGPQFLAAREKALVHLLCQEIAEGSSEKIDGKLLPDALNHFRLRHGLEAPDSVSPWLTNQGLDVAALTRLLRQELTTTRYRQLLDSDLEKTLIEQMRLSGIFSNFEKRAANKHNLLETHGIVNPELADSGVSEPELWQWFFHTHLELPDAPEPVDYAMQLGFRDLVSFRREVLREWLFQKIAAKNS